MKACISLIFQHLQLPLFGKSRPDLESSLGYTCIKAIVLCMKKVGVWKISLVACGVILIKIDFSDTK